MPPATRDRRIRCGPRRASAPARMIDGHPAAVVAHGLPSRQELTRTYCMKGTGTAAGIGAHAPRPPQTLDDRSGAVNASRHGRTAATAASRHATALFEPVPRRRRHRSGRLIRLMRLDPGPQRRIAQLQHLEQAQRAQGGQGLCDVAPGGLAAPRVRRRRTRRAHSPGTRPPCPCAPSRPGIRPGSRHRAVRLALSYRLLCRARRRDGALRALALR